MFLRKILKVINSRYFISSLFIVFELVILFLLQKYLNDYLLIFYVFSLKNMILFMCRCVIMNKEDKQLFIIIPIICFSQLFLILNK